MEDKYREAVRHFFDKTDETIEVLNEIGCKESWDKAQCAGAGKFLSNIYSSVENILQTVLRSRDIKIVKDDAWHKALLQKSRELGLFPGELYQSLYSMLQFRHVERAGYGIDLNEEEIRENIPDAVRTYSEFKSYVSAFIPDVGEVYSVVNRHKIVLK